MGFVDNTHHNHFGSDEFARCVVEGLRKTGLPLGAKLAHDLPRFDPDPIDTIRIPASPRASGAKPVGS